MTSQSTHPAHVLLVRNGMDHCACAKEQKCLEERVGEQVEHRRRIGRYACGKEHVTELRARGIRNHAFDVVLCEANGRSEEGR